MENTKIEKLPISTIGGSYAYAWQQMWKHFLYLFLVVVIVAFAEAPTSMIRESEFVATPAMIILQLLIAIYWLLVLSVINYGSDLMFLRGIRNQKIDIKEMFAGFRDNYINIVLANLFVFAIVGIGLVFLIVPGIILACRLAFVPYLVMDKKLEPVPAVEKSWEMTRGHGWKIFGMALLAIPIVIAGLLCFIFGIIFSIIWIAAAFSAMYHAVDLEDQERLNANGVEPIVEDQP